MNARSLGLSFIRHNSTSCATRFVPLTENYKTLRHIHFPGITPFQTGQDIQSDMVNANIHFKKLESKIIKQQRVAWSKGLTLSDYEDQFLKKILDMKPFPTLLTFEFENVYTGGKKMKQDPNLPERIKEFEGLGCKYYQLERGGETTWHGKGQLVAYLILDLKKFENLTVRCFVDSVLLRSVQETLKHKYGLSETFTNSNPGVWMSQDDLKISSVGCNIQRGISSYGIGLNIAPDLKYLNTFTMCGLSGTTATSVHEILPDLEQKDLNIKDVAFEYAKQVSKRLNITSLEHMDGEDLIKSIQGQNEPETESESGPETKSTL